ncbi:MAG: hypothetical protein LCH76_03485 [Actinobacteria bacterium]|nr:hypothetical protein [Actinomycetota bacterium]
MANNRWIALGALSILLSACTTPTVDPTPTSATPSATATTVPVSPPTPSPTPTWNNAQSAAVGAVERYEEVTAEIAADPSAFSAAEMTAMFAKAVGENMVKGNVDYFLEMSKRGYKEVGVRTATSTSATDVQDNGRGAEVHVTRCWDQRDLQVVDEDGKPVTDEEFLNPPYNLRQYTALKPTGEEIFRVYGAETINGACP